MSEAAVANKPVITRTVRVTVEAEVKVQLPEAFSTPDFIAEWCQYFWKIESIDEIAKYAASMAVQFGGGREYDGIGLLSLSYETYPRPGDVKYDILSDDIETEIIADGR